MPSNCKTLSDLFYQNRPHLSKAGTQGGEDRKVLKESLQQKKAAVELPVAGSAAPRSLSEREQGREDTRTCHKARRKKKASACIFQPYLHSTLFNFTPQRLHLQAYLHSTLHSTLLQGEHQTSKHPNIKNGRGRARTQAGEYAKPPKSRPSPCAHARRRTRSALRTFFSNP